MAPRTSGRHYQESIGQPTSDYSLSMTNGGMRWHKQKARWPLGRTGPRLRFVSGSEYAVSDPNCDAPLCDACKNEDLRRKLGNKPKRVTGCNCHQLQAWTTNTRKTLAMAAALVSVQAEKAGDAELAESMAWQALALDGRDPREVKRVERMEGIRAAWAIALACGRPAKRGTVPTDAPVVAEVTQVVPVDRPMSIGQEVEASRERRRYEAIRAEARPVTKPDGHTRYCACVRCTVAKRRA